VSGTKWRPPPPLSATCEGVRKPDVIMDYAEERPGEDWHAHGVTLKHLWVLGERKQRLVGRLRRQRWLRAVTKESRHDRPAWDVPNSAFGLDIMFVLLNVWLGGLVGLLHAQWPWTALRPSRRTVQRWAARLAPDAGPWLVAIRLACIELAAPRPLEENLPTGGIPPPVGRSRRHSNPASASQLRCSGWILQSVARALCMPIRTLLTEARRRWTTANPTTR
jgi:hypothetical protein